MTTRGASGGAMTSVLPDRGIRRSSSSPAPRSGMAPNALLLALSAGGALVLLLWWHDTSATLHTFGDWLTNAGRITGLLAGYVIIILLLLMARVPSLERDRVAAAHR